jgi:type I restriction enzyme M protein
MAKAKQQTQTAEKQLTIKRKEEKIWSHIRQIWLVETPEERVRQEYLCVLVNEYGYQLNQIDEETTVTGSGSGNARADFVIWRSPKDKTDKKIPLIVVECKADNVTINQKTYEQGANYAQYVRAKFFVTHNNRETKYWQVDLERLAPNYAEIENIPPVDASDKDIEELVSKLKVFKEDEFANLLHQCHNAIRNREKKDPAAAFDEIAKILFVKTGIERRMREGQSRTNLFTSDFLDGQKQIHDDPINVLFNQTKRDYETDRIFDEGEQIDLKFNTTKAIVTLLQKYNLSDTSEDIKGIAFERFLGRTFRGEIGQFFTPRSIVEFMIRMVEPQEGDVICDPASGSGGFLIRFFEIVRQKILADADKEYEIFKSELALRSELDDTEKARLLREKYDQIQKNIDQKKKDSRLWKLANRCIYGTDANDRMARTSKMNMIMHGDGHGGVHHHDGFININGIFEGRFDIVLTNPPFGANVEETDVIEEASVNIPEKIEEQYVKEFGDLYKEAMLRVRAAVGKSIASLFDLPKNVGSKTKTEILFIERCLSLLKPGGRLGIVLPEGIFNNPSLTYVREFCEDRAFIKAVVSLPQETFYSSGASVKASLLFMQKFTEIERQDFDTKKGKAKTKIDLKYSKEIEDETNRLNEAIANAKTEKDTLKRISFQKELKAYLKQVENIKNKETRALLKEQFSYPIFLYDADKVGIIATGEEDTNELYPNERQPLSSNITCLDLYHEFRDNPKKFMLHLEEAKL